MPDRRTLDDDLADLEATDPDVAAAADDLHWHAREAAMGWPQPRRIRKSPRPRPPEGLTGDR